jgi:hypothetical protein
VGTLRVMSRRGDDCVAWDTPRVVAGDPEAMAAVREAERLFRDQREHGATAFRITPGEAPVRLDEFDQGLEQIVIVPRIVGGRR